jgi:HlyD family type I secretion membrane fusion protein
MSIVKYIQPKQSNSPDLATLSFESATLEILARHDPWRERAVLYVLAAMIGVIIAFISVVRIDRIVTTTGRLVPIGGALTVQPLDKAIINRILVSVGDIVKKGQVLATCDPTFVRADLSELQQKIASLSAQKRRMEAEEAGQPFLPESSGPYDLLQASIWKQRAIEFTSGMSDFDQRISSSEAQILGLRQNIVDYRAHLKNATETEDIYTKGADAGIASHLQSIQAHDQKIEMERQLAQQEDTLASTQHLLESLKEQRTVFIKKWHDENLTTLAGVRDQLEQAENDLIKAKKLSELVNLVAPMDAVVLKIPNLSSGGVAMDAEPLFSLMPLDAPLEVDAQISARDNGFVKVGDPVTIKFETYKFLEHGTGEGVVKTISQDSFTEAPFQDPGSKSTEKETSEPYFDARITVTALHLHDVRSKILLVPGMTLQADIIVGRRTILWYLVGGAIRSGAEALHEP